MMYDDLPGLAGEERDRATSEAAPYPPDLSRVWRRSCERARRTLGRKRLPPGWNLRIIDLVNRSEGGS